jgi:hypothetical protein
MFKNEDDFKKLVGRLNIDDKPNPGHRENLRRRMLSVFSKTAEQPKPKSMSLRRTIMKSPINKLAVAAAVIIITVIGIYYLIPDDTSNENLNSVPKQSPTSGPEMVALDIKLPTPLFQGTPQDIKVDNLEKPLGKPRPPFYAPVGTKNVALGKQVSSTDEDPIIGEIEMITDGDKEGADGSYVELGPLEQHVTIDLEDEYNLYAIVVWHFHMMARAYLDVVVQVASDPDFTTNVATLFNNDIDNSSGHGVGKNMHYVETSEGKLIDCKGTVARYVRLYSNGNSTDDLNHYIEVEVYGKAAE